MLTNATHYLYRAPALVLIPGVCISVSVLALSIIGDTLRDALDPRTNDHNGRPPLGGAA